MLNDQDTAQFDSPATPEALWTVADVARFFGCTARHVVNLQANGLPHFYLGRLVRFDPAEVREYLKSNRRIAATKLRAQHGFTPCGRIDSRWELVLAVRS